MLDDLQSLQMPLYASIKQDGIRCRLDKNLDDIIRPMSRSLKCLPNFHIIDWAENFGIEGLDGEIVIPGWSFNDIQSWVMTSYPVTNHRFEFRVFDYLADLPFVHRMEEIEDLLLNQKTSTRIKIVRQYKVHTSSQLRELYETALDNEEEGLILRSPDGLYKSGRSTWDQAFSLKMKAFEDDEAIITGYYPLLENQNESVINELGLKKKSSHKSNQVLKEMLGGFEILHPTFGQFRIGSGPTAAQRILWWKYRTQLLGEEITFKFQRHGMKDKPRTPIIKSLNYLLPLQ